MSYKRKTQDEFEVQSYYPGSGWECVCTEETRQEARAQVKCYRENEPNRAHRVVKKRVKIDQQ